MRTRVGMVVRRFAVAMLLVLLGVGRAEADGAQTTLTVSARVVRSISVRSVAVGSPETAGTARAHRSAIETTVRGGDRDVLWAESRAERMGADGTKEVLVTVWADGEPPGVEL